MSSNLATEMVEFAHAKDKPLYRTALDAVAKAKHVRLVFLERQPRAERHVSLVAALTKPGMELAADGIIRSWLINKHTSMLTDFLDSLKIPHEKGVVEDVPATMDDATLQGAIDSLLAKYPAESVAVYLHAFHHMNDSRWANLGSLLENDARLKLGMPATTPA